VATLRWVELRPLIVGGDHSEKSPAGVAVPAIDYGEPALRVRPPDSMQSRLCQSGPRLVRSLEIMPGRQRPTAARLRRPAIQPSASHEDRGPGRA
jgi:hypothetical protein